MKCSIRAKAASRLATLAIGSLCAAVAFLLAGCSSSGMPSAVPAAGHSLALSGIVHGGQQAITGSTIQLYAVGNTGDKSASTPLLPPVTTSDGSGNAANSNANAGNAFNTLPAGSFNITGEFNCALAPGGSNAEVYIVGIGGNSGSGSNASIALMAALGPCSSVASMSYIFIDELTTVASVAALAPYMNSYSAIGSGSSDLSSLQAAFSAVGEYTNTVTGNVPGPSLPTGYYASSNEIATLGDIIAYCVNSGGLVQGQTTNCSTLFSDATPPSGAAPTDTVAAALDIVNNPTNNVCPLYGLAASNPPYQPALATCPANWNLPINQITVSVGGSASVYLGQTAQYTATVTGATNGQTGVTWAVNGVAGGSASTGTISTTGLYTPPASVPSSAVTISATSVLAASSGSVSVTVLPVTVAVSGPANVLFNQTGQYTATVSGPTTTVTWAVNGVTGGSSAEGTISTTGLYTAPASAPSTPVTITATSTAVASASGSKSITVSGTAFTYATGDSRTVTQPTQPTSANICTTLYAQFTVSQRTSPPSPDDTSRIQTALSSSACKNTGKFVELVVSGSNNAFYSTELNVTGEGLLIDSGVTLEANNGYSSQSELLNISGTNAGLIGPGTVDGRYDTGLITGQPRLVQTSTANNFIAYNVTLQNAAYPNLYVQGGNGATIWGVTILTPPDTANADGIDIDSITNVTVTNNTIEAGDDGVAIKTNAAAASNITVSNNKLYGTHGLSIGSQTFKGVTNVLFSNNYVYGVGLDGIASTDANAINIKTGATCGGLVQQVTYQNTCITQAKHLIVINAYYGACSGTAGTPQFQNILVNGVFSQNSVSGAYELFEGYNAANPINAGLAYINLDNVSQYSSNQYAGIALDSSNMTPSGTGITTSTFSTPGSVPSCSF